MAKDSMKYPKAFRKWMNDSGIKARGFALIPYRLAWIACEQYFSDKIEQSYQKFVTNGCVVDLIIDDLTREGNDD